MQAIGYVRVSTEEQAQGGVSLEAQKERIRAYCTMRGLELVEIVEDPGVSGGKALVTRPGGAKLTGATRLRHGPRAVVAWKLDRLFRDVVDCLEVTRQWDRRGVALHLIDLGGQAVDTASAMGRMFLTMMAAIAEWERNVIGERTAAALQHKAAHGEFTGQAPYGYRREGERVVPDEHELAVVEEVRRMAAEGMSRRAIAEQLTLDGRRPRGKRWHVNTVARILIERRTPTLKRVDTIVQTS